MFYGEGKCRAVNKDFMLYSIPTEKGESGGPIIRKEDGNEYIIGVHIGTIGELKKNTAVRLTEEKRKRINEWVGEITGQIDLSKLKSILERLELGDESMKEITEKWS